MSDAPPPHKPDANPDDPADSGATRRQSNVTPDDYPKSDGGRPDYGSPKRKD